MADVATRAGWAARVRNIRWQDIFSLQGLIIAGSLALVGYFALVPLSRLLYGTFYDGQALTLRFFEEAYSQYRIVEMAGNSVIFAVGSTLLAVSVGTSLAYLNVRTDVPLKRLIFAASLSPLVFLLMVAAFKSMDPSLEESALASGARLPTVIRRVTLPLVKPALFASILIIMVRGLEAFEVPALLGIPAGIWVFTSRIFNALRTYPIEYGNAGV